MGDGCIHIGEMLARNARMYPDKIALVERIPAEKKRFTITWRDFDERANKFSQILPGKGMKKGDKVMHLMNNSIDWLVAYFGIVRTGAWVVPLNFCFTADDIKYCASVAEPQLFLSGEEFEDRVSPISRSFLPTRTWSMRASQRRCTTSMSFHYLQNITLGLTGCSKNVARQAATFFAVRLSPLVWP